MNPPIQYEGRKAAEVGISNDKTCDSVDLHIFFLPYRKNTCPTVGISFIDEGKPLRDRGGTACHLLLAVSLSSGFPIFCLQSIPLAANLASPYRPMLFAMIDGPLASNYSTVTLLYSPVTSLSPTLSGPSPSASAFRQN